MVWKTSKVEERRLEFVQAVLGATASMASLCRRFEVSRPTGYKWVARFESEGEAGLRDRVSRPKVVRHELDERVRELLLEMRRAHPTWGSKKLLAGLRRRYPRAKRWPARSTVDALLKREGLIRPRRRRAHTPAHTAPLSHAVEPNDVWCIDFKVEMLLASGRYCYPLTITDARTRFALCCVALPSTNAAAVKDALRATFARYGLPRAVRSDNGTPFASSAPHGLSQVGVLLHRLGIVHERIEPGHPEQNGRHERFHRTLKADACKDPFASLAAAQRSFDRFVAVFNHDRPHEALGMRCPADVYESSPREMPARIPEVDLADADHVRQVSAEGHMKWRGHMLFVSSALARQRVGIVEVEPELFEVRFGRFVLGHLHDVRGAPVLLRRLATTRRRGRPKLSANAA